MRNDSSGFEHVFVGEEKNVRLHVELAAIRTMYLLLNNLVVLYRY